MNDWDAAIFDLDGTLFDSMGLWERIDVEFLAKRDIPVPGDYVANIRALSFPEAARYTIARFCLNESPEELIAEWNEMALHEYGSNIRLKPFAGEYLRRLKSGGLKLATATSLLDSLSEACLKNNDIYELFDAQATTLESGRGKEHPDVFRLAAQRLGVPPGRCVVFEDLKEGVESAKRAGMRVFAVYDKYSKCHMSEIMRLADGYLYDFRDAPLPVSN